MTKTRDPVVWIVASAGTAERWGSAVREAGVKAYPLAWGQVRSAVGPDAVASVLATGPWAFVLLTSPNAARAVPAGAGAALRAACVGSATAAAAREAGFSVDVVGSGTGADLATRLVAECPPGRVLWLRGRDVVSGAERRLRAAGFEVVSEVTYEIAPCNDLGARVRAAPEPGAVAIGSPRGARALASALGTDRLDLRSRPALAIGRTTAEALATLGFTDVRAPDVPGAAGLASLVRTVVRGEASP